MPIETHKRLSPVMGTLQNEILRRRHWLSGLLGLVAILLVACGSSATTAPTLDGSEPTATPGEGQPTATPVAAKTPGFASAKDNMTLVINEEPVTMNPFPTHGGIAAAPGKDNLVDPLTWQSGDNLEIVPTTATTRWEQLAGNRWRFFLREGVKFHNGEDWNAQAALPSLEYQGAGNNDNRSYSFTGGFAAEAVDDYTVDITCDQDCPIFPNTTIFLNFTAPDYYANASEEEFATRAVTLGPYKQVRWDPGVSLTMEAYEDYVPAGDHYEFQKALVRDVTWLWRGEPTVATAMIQGGEADMAWDVGVDAIGVLPSEQIKSGSSAETFVFWMNTLWHPELKKKEVRQAIVHAINCQELVDSLYGGLPPCRGNAIWPGVIGATERNTAPYEHNPDLSRQLLAEAGYNPSNKITISGRAARLPKLTEVYEALQGYLTAVGMNVEINVVEPSIWAQLRDCGIGIAVNEVMEAQGKDPNVDQPTSADMQAALDKGGANCTTADLRETEPGLETLDFGKIANDDLNCVRGKASVCDPSPGGLQEQLAPALAASGEERQRLLQAIADRVHDDVLVLPLFEPPTIYGVNPKLNWEPRFDRRVRVNTMWFSP